MTFKNLIFRAIPPSRKSYLPSIITEVPRETTMSNLQVYVFIVRDKLNSKYTEHMFREREGTKVPPAVSEARGNCDKARRPLKSVPTLKRLMVLQVPTPEDVEATLDLAKKTVTKPLRQDS